MTSAPQPTSSERLYTAALDYIKQGWAIFPLAANSKAPHPALAPHGFKSASRDQQVVSQWFQLQNITGIGTEPGLTGHVVLDIDDRHAGADSLAALEAIYGKLPDTMTAITPGGEHRWFRIHVGEAIRTNSFGSAYPGIDVISTGRYVVLPPSQHPTGGFYAWDASNAPAVDLPEAWLQALGDSERVGQREPIPGLHDHARILDGHRNKVLTRVVGKFRSLGMVPEVIADVAHSLNRRQCDPPLPDQEVDELAIYAGSNWPVRENLLAVSENGAPLSDLTSPKFLTVAELYALPPETADWLLEGILPSAGTSLCGAKPKVGKSTFARNLTLCVARGEHFLGRHTTRGTVLYASIEDKAGELRRLFRAMGVTEGDPILTYCGRTPDFGDAVKWLRATAQSHRPVLIVIDTLQRFARFHDINDYARVTNALDPLMHLARETGAHILVTHHAKKTGGSDGDAVLGSTALFGAVDTLLDMQRVDGRRTLRTYQRYGQDLEETILALDPQTYLLTATGSVAGAECRDAETRILDYLEGRTERATRDQVLEEFGGRTQACTDALKALVASGRIVREGSGRKGDPFLFSVPSLYAGTAERNGSVAAGPGDVEEGPTFAGYPWDTQLAYPPEDDPGQLEAGDEIAADAEQFWRAMAA